MKELTWHERGRLWLRLGLRLVIAALALGLCTALGPTLISLLAPFLLAFAVAWAIAPAVRWLHESLALPRRAAALAVLALAFGALAAAVWWLVSAAAREIAALAGDWQTLVASFQSLTDTMDGALSRVTALLPTEVWETVKGLEASLFTFLETAVPQVLGRGMDAAANVARALPSFLVAAVVFVMAAYFFTAEYPRMRSAVADALPKGPRVLLAQIHRAARVGFGGYIRAQLILSFVIFFILLFGFLLIRQPYALLLAVALAVLDFIPILGSGTVLVPWTVMDVIVGEYRHAIGLMAVWGVVALFRRLAEPKVLGDQTGLSPLASLVSVYVGMKVAGVPGMILGPVLCLVLSNLYRSGVLDRTVADVRMALGDISAVLRGGDESRE